MRTLDLLKAFSTPELKELEKAVSENKRQSLSALFKELKSMINSTKEPDNAAIFKKVFGKPYTKKNDYLLRNELRLLNKLLYEHLAMTAYRDDIRRSESNFNLWLLKGLFNRKVKPLFESDVDKFISTSVAESKFQETAQMHYYKSLWLIGHLPRTPENLKNHMALLQEYKTQEKRVFLQKIREIEAQEAYLQIELDFLQNPDIVIQYENRKTPGETVFDLSGLARDDWYACYLELKKHVFQTNKQANIEVLKQKLAIESSPEHSAFFSIDNRVFTLGHLARELMLLGQYTETDQYHEQLVAKCREYKIPMRAGHIQNYMANQLYLKKYERALTIFEEYREQISRSHLYGNIAVLASFCHLFMQRPDEAIALIPPSPSLTQTDLLMSRLIYPVAYYIRGDTGLAYSECTNLRRTIKSNMSNTESTLQYRAANLLVQFFQVAIKDKYSRADDMKTLCASVRKAASEDPTLDASEYAVLWLAAEMDAIQTTPGVLK